MDLGTFATNVIATAVPATVAILCAAQLESYYLLNSTVSVGTLAKYKASDSLTS
jgi:uncharacterized protein YejL (UPF0352 family)